MVQTLSVTEVARHFAEYIDRVSYRGESFVLARGNKPVAGKVIGPNDLWLAATCLAQGLTMVTANVREFSRVPGLSVEVWEEPA